MPTLSTTVDGLRLPNPFVIASGPPGTNLNVIQRAFREGWGAVIAKTVSLDASKVINVTPRYGKLHAADKREIVGWENIELISDRPIETLAFRHRRRGDWRGRRSAHPRGRKFRSSLHGCDEIRLRIDQASLRGTSRLSWTNTTSKVSTTFEATASYTSPRTRSSCVSRKRERLRSEFPSRVDSSRLTAIGAAIGSLNNPPL